MNFEVKVFNGRVVETKFNRMGAKVKDARPAFRRIVDRLYAIEKAMFESGGRRGGGSWKRVSSEWMARKIREGRDLRTMHYTGDLRRSLTEPGAKYQVLRVGKTQLVFGTTRPGAEAHQHGRGVPRRPVIRLTKRDRAMFRDEIRKHLMTVWRRRTRLA